MARAARWPRRREQTADEALIRHLYNQHGGALLAYASRLTQDQAHAEDVVQEALIRAWRHPEALTDNKGSVRGWLFTVVRNIATDFHRARAARPIEVAETITTAPVQDDFSDSVIDTVLVLEALEHLSPDHRAVVTQIYLKGLSVNEAAAALGVPEGTVKSRCYYALKRMHELIMAASTGPDRSRAEEVAG